MSTVINSRSFGLCDEVNDLNFKPVACLFDSIADDVLNEVLELTLVSIRNGVKCFIIVEHQIGRILIIFADYVFLQLPTGVQI